MFIFFLICIAMKNDRPATA